MLRKWMPLFLIISLCIFALGCRSEEEKNPLPGNVEIPSQLKQGEKLYIDNCQKCHGEQATGSQTGPPLVDIIYEPKHHSDQSFQVAVQSGTPQHHWNFGNMPPVKGVAPEQVTQITTYVRFLQQEAGIQ